MSGPDPFRAHQQQFLDSLQDRSPHTIAAYRRDIDDFCQHLRAVGIACWSDVDVHGVRHYVAERHRAGAQGRSIARALAALRALFRFLAQRQLIGDNPALTIRAPRSERRLPHTLDVDQMSKLLEVQDGSVLAVRDQAMWELLYSSGLRVSELTGLDVADVSLSEGQARVLGKGRKQRIVPVGRIALEALRRWLKVRGELLRDNDLKAMFIGQRGARLTTRNVQLRLREWARRHGINEAVHPHMLRHSFASHMLESCGDLRAVQELLGHANISTTQIYTHLDFQHLARVYDGAHPRARRRRD